MPALTFRRPFPAGLNSLVLRETLRRSLIVAVAAFAVVHLGPVGGSIEVPALWLFAGLAFAASVRWGVRMAPALMLGAAGALIAQGTEPESATVLAVMHAGVAAMCGGWLRRHGFQPSLASRHDLKVFALASGAAALLAAALTGGWLAFTGAVAPAAAPRSLLHWLLAFAGGTLALGVPLLALSREAVQHATTGHRWMGTSLLAAGATLVGVVALAPRAADSSPLWALIFAPHLLLCWMAARRGLLPASATALALSLAAVVATGRGNGPLFQPDQDLELLWGYLFSLFAAPLGVSGLLGERQADGERWRLALETAQLGWAEWDLKRDRVLLSRRWQNLLARPAQEAPQEAATAWAGVHPDDRAAFDAAWRSLAPEHRRSARAEFRMKHPDGTWRWLEAHAMVAQRDPKGEPLRLMLTARDIDERHAADERRRLSARLFQHLHEGLLITDAEHRVLDINPMFSRITGYTREEIIGTLSPLMRPMAPDSPAARQQAQMLAALRSKGSWRGELVERRRDGETCTLHVVISAVRGHSDETRFYAVALEDVTAARLQRDQLERQAHCDDLTGLANRSRLAQMLRSAMVSAERESYLLTVCYLDLDHFKPVNDRFGHEAGDRLLVELAARLRRSLRHWASGDDAVARLGGDEFVLLLRTATLQEARHAVERVLRSVCQPYALGPGIGPVVVTASIGATVYPSDRADADADTLLRHADHAMYGAKQAGRNGYLFFDAENDRRTAEHFEALGRVQDALEADQFVLYYQPKVDMRAGKVMGMEALLRWRHPTHGVIAPAQFLPLIEHTGLSVRLGEWVLQQGIAQLAQWQREGLDINVSINVSARHLQEPNFGARLAALLEQQGTPVADRLTIEVLETAALADVDYTCALMQQCRALGVRFALDDFGTGYSTFTYLKRLPLDVLKIDRSFVHNMLADPQDMAIVEGVIGLSQTFGCTVVAEGVESSEQAQRLITLGCDIGQGNGIARAMPVDEVHAWALGWRGEVGLTPAAVELAH